MQKITTHLWFDKEAKEAAQFYVSAFANGSKVKNVTTIRNTPSGDRDVVSFELLDRSFMGLSAGPLFKFNPSISFHVKCKTKDDVDALWKKLRAGGTVLMELGAYPWSEKYGWTQDKYGLSWQIIFVGESDMKQKITPFMMFVGNVCGKAEKAINFYASVFHNAKVRNVVRYGKGDQPDKEGTIKYAAFTLEGQEFGAMDSAHEHKFAFNEAISFIVHCNTQEEIDYYWGKLSADPKAEQCGWLKDKYGLSWQIVPTIMEEMMGGKDEKKMARVTQAFLNMKKFNIDSLKRAYERE